MTDTIAILGSGLTGIAVANKLSREGRNVTIFEKENEVGGLARSFDLQRCTFDIGPHVFRSYDQKLLSFVKSLTNVISIQSDPKIWKRPGVLHDAVTPIISSRNLSFLGEDKKNKALEEYAEKRKMETRRNMESFEDCVKAQIGEILYEEYFQEYTEKFWGVSPKELSVDMAPRGLTIAEDTYYSHATMSYQRPRTEIYPIRGGIGEIAKRLVERAKEKGATIVTGAEVVDFVTDRNLIKSIITKTGDSEIEYPCSFVISTVPITQIAQILKIPCRLTYRSLVCIYIIANEKQLFRNKWLYFHDKDVLFSRVSEVKLFSRLNAPSNKTGLCVEVTCQIGDGIWNDPYVADKIIEQLDYLGILKENEANVAGTIKIPYAYPVFTRNYKSQLITVKKRLLEFQNLQLIGRTGSFELSNMDSAIKEII